MPKPKKDNENVDQIDVAAALRAFGERLTKIEERLEAREREDAEQLADSLPTGMRSRVDAGQRAPFISETYRRVGR